MIIMFYSKKIVFLGDTHLLMKTILQWILLSCEYLKSKPITQAWVTVLHHNSNWKNRTFVGVTTNDNQSYCDKVTFSTSRRMKPSYPGYHPFRIRAMCPHFGYTHTSQVLRYMLYRLLCTSSLSNTQSTWILPLPCP